MGSPSAGVGQDATDTGEPEPGSTDRRVLASAVRMTLMLALVLGGIWFWMFSSATFEIHGDGPKEHRKALAEVAEIGSGIGTYFTLTGRMPASLDDLRLPQERNADDSIIDNGDDPWGRPYGFTVDGTRAATISCLGADGVPGGVGSDEDIVLHWPPPKNPPPR